MNQQVNQKRSTLDDKLDFNRSDITDTLSSPPPTLPNRGGRIIVLSACVIVAALATIAVWDSRNMYHISITRYEVPRGLDETSQELTNEQTENSDFDLQELKRIDESVLEVGDVRASIKNDAMNTVSEEVKKIVPSEDGTKPQLAIENEISHLSQIIKAHYVAPDLSREIATVIVKGAKELDLDPIFITAIAMAESSLKPHARSKTGKLGLLQISEEYASHILKASGEDSKPTDLLSVTDNLKIGMTGLHILSKQLSGDTDKILMHYNLGQLDAQKSVSKTPHLSRYLRNVEKYRAKWASIPLRSP